MVRKAVIDIGTNTTRLLIADLTQKKTFTNVFSRQIITRLGEGLFNHKHLNEVAVQRTLDALTIYSRDIKKYNCSQVRIVATSAAREAENREVFVQKVKNKTGMHLEVISQEEEAHLATMGVFKGLKEKPEKAVIFDIGGGSTEFILADKTAHPLKIIGLPMGIVHLTEKYIHSDPVNQEELQSLRIEVRKELSKVKEEIGHVKKFTLIGTAGTSTQFAALDLDLFPYDPVAINGHNMSLSAIEKILNNLQSKTIAERKTIRAMEQGREDLIIAGGVMLVESIKLFNKKEVTISDFGLREGIIIA